MSISLICMVMAVVHIISYMKGLNTSDASDRRSGVIHVMLQIVKLALISTENGQARIVENKDALDLRAFYFSEGSPPPLF